MACRTCQGLESVQVVLENTHGSGEVINPLLPSKKDRRCYNRLHQLASDALVQPSNTLMVDDVENTVPRGFVLEGGILTRLQATLDDDLSNKAHQPDDLERLRG